LKVELKSTPAAPEVHRIYRHATEVSNKKIGRCLHTYLHNFAKLYKLLKMMNNMQLFTLNTYLAQQ
jgi:hypothetical protein